MKKSILLTFALFSIVGCSGNNLPSGNVSYLCVANKCDTPNGLVDPNNEHYKIDQKRHSGFNYYRLNKNQNEIIGVRKGTILETVIDKNNATAI